MMELFKMKEEYMNQHWYNSRDVFEIDSVNFDRFFYYFGTDCTWINFRTKEKINI